jgi:hypothetical protein
MAALESRPLIHPLLCHIPFSVKGNLLYIANNSEAELLDVARTTSILLAPQLTTSCGNFVLSLGCNRPREFSYLIYQDQHNYRNTWCAALQSVDNFFLY